MARLSSARSRKFTMEDTDSPTNNPTLNNESVKPTISESDTDDTDKDVPPYDISLLPNGTRSLSWIGLQSFGLGAVFSLCTLSTAFFLLAESRYWKLPAFILCLSVFHFLEFYTTARWNVPAARANSFLLFNNGRAYTVAHGMATLEITISFFFPAYQDALVNRYTLLAGVLLVVGGQAMRSVAMAQAGTNFNHLIAQEQKENHELVTRGVYTFSRHPSYFGFFWWAIGTQFLVGNKLCMVGYVIALWRFFSNRIKIEEAYLVRFFGQSYEDYKKRTGTKIPFIR